MRSFEEAFQSSILGGVVGTLVVAVLFLFPLWRSLSRAGFSPGWALLTLIPYLWPLTIFAIVGMLAFGQWPAIVGKDEPSSWRPFSSTSWEMVSPEEARRNRHYGVDGYLLALYGLAAAGTAMNIIYYFSPNYLIEAQRIYGMSASGAKVMLLLIVGWGLVLLCLIPMKRPIIPKLMIAGAWIYWFLFLLVVAGFGEINAAALYALPSGALFALLQSWYWLNSKRVNVTYLHKIPAR